MEKNEINKIIDISKNKTTICFDIFDTLLHRNVNGEYVKKIWAGYISNVFSEEYNANEIYEIRRNIEATCCEQNYKNGYDKEVTYKQIIENMYSKLNIKSYSFIDFYDKCLWFEYKIEESVLYVDDHIISLLDDLRKEKKELYCISDMYLPKKTIKELLFSKGLSNYFKDVFVSSEKKLTKNSGRLYNYVFKKINVKKENILMIGDNEYSDYKSCLEIGVDSYLINSSIYKEFYQKFERENSFLSNNSKIKSFDLKSDKKPFADVSFSLYKFTESLYYKLLKDGFNDAFFCAREGKFFKKIFDEYQKNIYGPKINTHYILVSRRATFLPSLDSIKNEKFKTLFIQYHVLSLRTFMKNLSFSNDEINSIVLDMKIKDPDKEISNFPKSKLFLNLKKNQLFISIYNEKRLKAKTYFMNYINSFNVSLRNGFAMVDVGWKGTIQNNIKKILKKVNVKGYYLGLVNYIKTTDYDDKVGVLFEATLNNKSKNNNLFNLNRSIYEILLDADHGSTLSYDENGPVIDNNKKELDLYYNVIEPIQEDMFKMYMKILNTIPFNYYDKNMFERIINKKQFRINCEPTSEELELYNKFYHFENFGPLNYTDFSEKLKFNILDKINFYIHIRTNFRNNDYWQMIYLYNKNLKFAMVIYRNYKLLRYKKERLF
ncbi:MAG: HAD-IA family hydrolase [Bacilli bacterium]